MEISVKTSLPASAAAPSQVKSEIASLQQQIQQLGIKLTKVPSTEGMSPEEKKEMAAMIQQQIEALNAILMQLIRQQAEKAEKSTASETARKDGNDDGQRIDVFV